MRILVAGASGAVGRYLVPQLVAAGHKVVGTGRSDQSLAAIQKLGAPALAMDGLDSASVSQAVQQAKPEVIIHQMTQLAGASDLRQFEKAFATSNRLRTEGLEHLISAGTACGVKRIVAQSFCGWPYARVGGNIKSEIDPLDDNPPREMRTTLEAIRFLEGRLQSLKNMDGVVLRYGGFYGPSSGLLEPNFIDQVRHRKAPLIGGGNGWWSFIHLADAASATAAFVDRGSPGIYNVVDDDPAPVRVWLPFLAEILGAKHPIKIPAWIASLAAGDHVVKMMTEIRAGSNAKLKAEMAWKPQYPSWRQGVPDALGISNKK